MTVTATGTGESTIDDKTVVFTPYPGFTATGTAMTWAANKGSQVGSWSCAAGDMASKYLPGSCK